MSTYDELKQLAELRPLLVWWSNLRSKLEFAGCSTLMNILQPRIERVTLLRTDEPFVRAMNASIESDNKIAYMHSCTVSGVEIPQAVLFHSRRVAA